MRALNGPDHRREVTKRFVLYVGFKCNLRCQFCYYLKSIEDGTAKNSTFETLAAQIRHAHKLGKTEIDFTGGEATIHPDLEKLIALCKELGFTTINVITNGFKIANKDALKKFVDAGLNEVLFSLHSYDEKVHDALTQIPKSQSRILQAIRNAHELGIRVRINTVVNKMNYLDLENHLNYVLALQPASVNLIVFNPTEETIGYPGHDNVRLASYEDIGQKIGEAVDLFQDKFDAFNVRFLPFCYAKGRETVMRSYWQEIYERQEWDPMLHWAFRRNWWFVAAAVIAGFILSLVQRTHVWHGRKNLYTRLSEFFQLARTKYLFTQKKDCASCSLRLVCPGLPRDFAKKSPDANVYPYTEGEIPTVINPVVYGYRYPDKFPSVQARSYEI